jgi:hypothetical protein
LALTYAANQEALPLIGVSPNELLSEATASSVDPGGRSRPSAFH